MIALHPLTAEQFETILDWNRGKDSLFLMQWAGTKYTFPLTREQLMNQLDQHACLYAIQDGERMIGTIQLIRCNPAEASGHFGGFLLDPALRGQGLGSKSLAAFCEFAFEEFSLRKLTLHVYAFNEAAIRCYEKNGFVTSERFMADNGYETLRMELSRPGSEAGCSFPNPESDAASN